MTFRRIVFMTAAVAILAGCSAAPTPKPTSPAPLPTPTVTVTVAATPQPRGPDDAVDSYFAWYFCKAEVFHYMAGVNPPFTDTSFNTYDPQFISDTDGHFWIQIIGPMNDEGAESAHCVISGTVGAPIVDDYRYPN